MKTKKMDWSQVVDEICDCGHKKSEHLPLQEDVKRQGAPKELIESLSGNNQCSKCECQKYRWSYFIDADGKKM